MLVAVEIFGDLGGYTSFPDNWCDMRYDNRKDKLLNSPVNMRTAASKP